MSIFLSIGRITIHPTWCVLLKEPIRTKLILIRIRNHFSLAPKIPSQLLGPSEDSLDYWGESLIILPVTIPLTCRWSSVVLNPGQVVSFLLAVNFFSVGYLMEWRPWILSFLLVAWYESHQYKEPDNDKMNRAQSRQVRRTSSRE